MHQDLQTFSDIMDIDFKNQLKICLSVIEHGALWYEIKINNQIVKSKNFETTIGLFDDIDLKVKILLNEQNHSALEIKNFTVNGKEVLPLYQHLASENTCWIRQGEWQYYIPGPFYTWYHITSGQGWIA